jgi:hypothetical protein
MGRRKSELGLALQARRAQCPIRNRKSQNGDENGPDWARTSGGKTLEELLDFPVIGSKCVNCGQVKSNSSLARGRDAPLLNRDGHAQQNRCSTETRR